MNREIEYILEVSKHESILKASKNLFITPSALSKYIKQTEEKYGVRFFDRVGKKFTLTYAGERYLYWLHQQERVITNMENELYNIAGSQSGRIRVGIQSTLARFWLNHVLVPFKAAYPDINVELIDDINPEIARMINNNELDFVILQEDNSYLQNTIYQHLVMAHLVVASSKNNDKLQQCSQQKRHHKYPWIPLDKLDGILFVLPSTIQTFVKILICCSAVKI